MSCRVVFSLCCYFLFFFFFFLNWFVLVFFYFFLPSYLSRLLPITHTLCIALWVRVLSAHALYVCVCVCVVSCIFCVLLIFFSSLICFSFFCQTIHLSRVLQQLLTRCVRALWVCVLSLLALYVCSCAVRVRAVCVCCELQSYIFSMLLFFIFLFLFS